MANSRKGVAMLVIISLILMLLILGGAVLMISTGHFGTTYHQIRRARAYYAAEAAMQHTLWDLRANGVTPGTLALPADFEVNGIEDDDINITIGNLGAEVPGTHRIDIEIPSY